MATAADADFAVGAADRHLFADGTVTVRSQDTEFLVMGAFPTKLAATIILAALLAVAGADRWLLLNAGVVDAAALAAEDGLARILPAGNGHRAGAAAGLLLFLTRPRLGIAGAVRERLAGVVDTLHIT